MVEKSISIDSVTLLAGVLEEGESTVAPAPSVIAPNSRRREAKKQAEHSRLPRPHEACYEGTIRQIAAHRPAARAGQRREAIAMTTSPQVLTFEGLAQRLSTDLRPSRRIVAIVGAPGSGKSTVAERLVDQLNAGAAGSAALFPMDGYHYDDAILIARGLRPRKGAPETFDVAGLLNMLGRLKANQEDEIAVPVFDRDLEISRAGARMIPRTARVIVVEGNYLLLREPPWAHLRPMFDVTVSLDVAEDVLRARLTQRWRSYGLPPAEIAAKVEGNDIPNGRFVIANSLPADFALRL